MVTVPIGNQHTYGVQTTFNPRSRTAKIKTYKAMLKVACHLDVKTRPTSEKNKIMLTNFEKYVGTIN
jgi:hypothetical protein